MIATTVMNDLFLAFILFLDLGESCAGTYPGIALNSFALQKRFTHGWISLLLVWLSILNDSVMRSFYFSCFNGADSYNNFILEKVVGALYEYSCNKT